MGHCYEFETEIQAGCDHPMVAQADSCVCPDCGARCTGKFNGCAAVWARGDVGVELFAPARRGDARTPDRAAGLPPMERAAPVGPHDAPEPATDASWGEPVVEALVESEREPALQAIVVDTEDEPTEDPAIEGIDEPAVEPIDESVVEPIASATDEAPVARDEEPVAQPLVEPAVAARDEEPVAQPVVGPAVAARDEAPVAQPLVEATSEPGYETLVQTRDETSALHAEPAPPNEFDVDLAWPDPGDAPEGATPDDGEPVPATPRLPTSPESLYVKWSDSELQRVVASAFRGPIDDEAPARVRAAEPTNGATGLELAPDRNQSVPTSAGGVTTQRVAPRPKPTAPVKVVMPSTRPERRAQRSRWIVVVGALAAVGVIAALAALGALLQRGSGEATTPTPAAPGPTRLVFDTVTISDGITADRVWELHGREGRRFEASITYTNTTSAPVTRVHEEVVPKSLASSVDDIDFDSIPTTIVETDPVVQFDITVPANDELTLRYAIDVEPDGNRRARLEQWASDLGAELARRAAAVAVPATAPPETTPPPPATRRATSNRPIAPPAPEPEPAPPPPSEPPTTSTTSTTTTTTAP